jgi:DNA polymerase-3 subunit gamma/tau
MAKVSTEVPHAPMALYRKYRPKTFDDIYGDQQVVEVLRAAIQKGEIAHAYLFAGGRGTGKTSMARILARALETRDEDIYEMDAASNRGIDEIRELREGVATLPFNSRYKFYIIDEAHALTKDAWGAFLKTLEEPPAHAIFVLATTELDRVPETIQSRCQVFRFKKPSHEILKKLVLDVAKKEGVKLEPAGAELIALVGDGSFRDTLGTLQKALTVAGDKTLSEEEIAKVVGAPPGRLVSDFLEALVQHNIEGALSAFHRSVAQGAEPGMFVLLAVAKIRAVLLLRFAPKMKKELAEQFGEDDLALIEQWAGTQGARLNSQTLAEMLTALIETPRAPVPALPLELALYRLSA